MKKSFNKVCCIWSANFTSIERCDILRAIYHCAPTHFGVLLQNIAVNVYQIIYQTGEFSSVKSTYFLSELYIFIHKVLDLDSIF